MKRILKSLGCRELEGRGMGSHGVEKRRYTHTRAAWQGSVIEHAFVGRRGEGVWVGRKEDGPRAPSSWKRWTEGVSLLKID